MQTPFSRPVGAFSQGARSADAPRDQRSSAIEGDARRARIASGVTIALSVGSAAAAALLLGQHDDEARRRGGLALLGASAGIALVRWQLPRLFTEQAPYELERRIGPLEVRAYGPEMRAETVVESTRWHDGLDEGFRRLARYIFGDNDVAVHFHVGIPVARVARRPARARGETMAMTSPVLSTVGAADALEQHTVAFVLPRDHDPRTLPTPRDPRIRLCPIPARHVAVLRFRGRYGGSLPGEKADELRRRLRDAGLAPRGEVSFAGYDPPTTIPWLRRNEVMVDVEDPLG
jgi:hypothetical protein